MAAPCRSEREVQNLNLRLVEKTGMAFAYPAGSSWAICDREGLSRLPNSEANRRRLWGVEGLPGRITRPWDSTQ